MTTKKESNEGLKKMKKIQLKGLEKILKIDSNALGQIFNLAQRSVVDEQKTR